MSQYNTTLKKQKE